MDEDDTPMYVNHFKLALTGETSDAQITFFHRVADPDNPGEVIEERGAELTLSQTTLKDLGHTASRAVSVIEDWQRSREQQMESEAAERAMAKMVERVASSDPAADTDKPN